MWTEYLHRISSKGNKDYVLINDGFTWGQEMIKHSLKLNKPKLSCNTLTIRASADEHNILFFIFLSFSVTVSSSQNPNGADPKLLITATSLLDVP